MNNSRKLNKIKKLAELKENGIINDQEFEIEKQKILSKKSFMPLKIIFIGIGSVMLVNIVLIVISLNLNYKGELIGIAGTNVYHRDNCQFIKKASLATLIYFKNLDDTVYKNDGKLYRPCKSCNPPSNNENIIKYREDRRKEVEAIKKRELEALKRDFDKGIVLERIDLENLYKNNYITKNQYNEGKLLFLKSLKRKLDKGAILDTETLKELLKHNLITKERFDSSNKTYKDASVVDLIISQNRFGTY